MDSWQRSFSVLELMSVEDLASKPTSLDITVHQKQKDHLKMSRSGALSHTIWTNFQAEKESKHKSQLQLLLPSKETK
jgi:hypothetical protein